MRIDPNAGIGSWEDHDVVDPKTGLRIADIDIAAADEEAGTLDLAVSLGYEGETTRLIQTGPDGEIIRIRVKGIPFKIVPMSEPAPKPRPASIPWWRRILGCTA